MSEETVVPPRAKKEAKAKAVTERKAAAAKKHKSKGVVVHQAMTIPGVPPDDKVTVRANTLTVARVKSVLEELGEDDMSAEEVVGMVEAVLLMFDATDGTRSRESSRERVAYALNNALIDVADLEPALQRVGSLMDKETKRPLG